MKMSQIMQYEQFKVFADILHTQHICAAYYHGRLDFHPVKIENATLIKKGNSLEESTYEVEVNIGDFDNSLDDNGLYYYKTSIIEIIRYFLNRQLICATCGEQINHLLADEYIKKSGNREHEVKRLCEKCLIACDNCGEQIPSANYYNVFSDYMNNGHLHVCEKC